LRADRVELVEQVDAGRLLHGVEDEAELRRRLAHVLRDQAVEPYREERQAELARKSARGHRLPGARRSDEKQLPSRGDPMGSQLVLLADFAKAAVELPARALVEDHVVEAHLWVRRG